MQMETSREQTEREREGGGEKERSRCNNVAFVRGRNSGHIEHLTVTRWERPDEQRAGKEGDERERGNKRRRLRITAKSFNGTCQGRRAGLGAQRLGITARFVINRVHWFLIARYSRPVFDVRRNITTGSRR